MENEPTELSESIQIAEVLQTRIPEAVDGIQVNFCKNPRCKNFGKPASTHAQPRGRYASSFKHERDDYTLSGDNLKTALVCHSCGRQSAVKSNRAIKEELDRITAYLAPNIDKEPSCPVDECPNHVIGLSAGKKHYQSFGKTKVGSPRYRCKSCGKTFSVQKSTINRQRRTSHKNAYVFSLVMNKNGFRRMRKITGLGMWTIFKKIDFIHKQCMAFAASRERKLYNGDIPFERLYISVDRQVYSVNYSDSKDETNISMPAVCSADNTTGYLFGLNLNYDPAVDREKIEYEAQLCRDSLKPIAHRRFARLWMSPDYEVAATRKIKKIKESLPLPENTAVSNDVAVDIEEEPTDEVAKIKKPRKFGMQVHAEYTSYAHFLMLKKLCRNTEKVRLFIDQDTSFLGASMSAFYEKIMGGYCDVFYVRIKSEMPIFEKKMAVMETKNVLKRLKYEHPEKTPDELRHELIKERMKNLVNLGNTKDKWLVHPIATMDEPVKQVCFLTDDGKYDEDHVAHLYSKASLQGIDKAFNQIRSYISVLDRAGTSSFNRARLYFRENAYNPERIIKLLDIFRVYHNYHLVSDRKGSDKKTPAMRLGLAQAPTPLEDILYFKP